MTGMLYSWQEYPESTGSREIELQVKSRIVTQTTIRQVKIHGIRSFIMLCNEFMKQDKVKSSELDYFGEKKDF